MKKSLVALATVGVLASGAAAADTYVRISDGRIHAYAVQHDPRYENQRWNDGRNFSIDQREANMRNRIQRGIESGRVTRREARQLLRELDDIEAKERAFAADGRLGRRERDELHNDLDHLANRIRAQLRDEDRRY
ncbi:MAG TPA: hypothetical protein VNG69_18415 [Casimicrobiaceae bacterium]|nr:hypothetical protein [Casimicrobiaceae bacterium]